MEIVTLPVSRWQEYKELRLKAIQKEPHAFCSTYKKEVAWSDQKWQQGLRDVADRKSWIFFAKINRKLVGLIGGFQNDEDRQNDRAQIWGMYVDDLYRGRGIAEALAERLLCEISKNEDIHVIRLEVNEEQEAAMNLYKRLGFKEVNAETAVFGDGLTYKALIMEKLV